MPKKPSEINESWNVWGKHVLEELRRLNGNYEDLKKKIDSTQTEVWKAIGELQIEGAKFKVKSGVWGLIGGALAVIPTLVFLFLERK